MFTARTLAAACLGPEVNLQNVPQMVRWLPFLPLPTNDIDTSACSRRGPPRKATSSKTSDQSPCIDSVSDGVLPPPFSGRRPEGEVLDIRGCYALSVKQVKIRFKVNRKLSAGYGEL